MTPTPLPPSSPARLLAEYAEPEALVRAIQRVRAQGYTRLEAYTPYPVHGLDEALGARRSRLPSVVVVVGFAAAGAAYFLQWLLNAYLYPLDVGHRPPHFPLAFVPITFEMGVLLAATAAFLGVLVLGRLLTLWHPVFEASGFGSATNDSYWLEVSARDPHFDPERTMNDLLASGARHVAAVGGPW